MRTIILSIALLAFTGLATAQETMSGQLSKNTNMSDVKEIYFAGGCFWGTEHFMKQINGVVHTQVGYANGKMSIKNPTYEQVCSDDTGFAETVKVSYNPQQADLKLLIDLFLRLSTRPLSTGRVMTGERSIAPASIMPMKRIGLLSNRR